MTDAPVRRRAPGAAVVAAMAASLLAVDAARAAPADDDPDARAEARSSLWEHAIDPDAATYAELVDDAAAALAAAPAAIQPEVERAVQRAQALAPGRPTAHFLAGRIAETRQRWSDCAAAYQQMIAADPRYEPPSALRPRAGLVHARASCLARAGQLERAAALLARAAAAGPVPTEHWLAAGEIALAQGRLEDALGHLDRASAPDPDPMTARTAGWLAALAHDRAGRPADVAAAVRAATAADGAGLATGRRARRCSIPPTPTTCRRCARAARRPRRRAGDLARARRRRR
ncbi:MAG: hypothetical protein R2939_19680 [Kofleriaceae bacterium]